ncbi:MAG: hypothetical protein A3I11_06805 [Elusimicrobia bacterium RIFCSPLOWO2_02_FULL_39_32]|nr:MAG: hypothetical protein A2034_04725 [Elusimicrobia bacterium GWA2_38_7]OGR91001.1 MAG: hypothetical protein A3I11_06805 [Elusimicrobia bacterium RIFCSPLOWO2_02_FULL_39_32]OGR98309.1 MAG: hypothetical protein A3G85_07570 [Elusimicrobia bacterium RIFCSPLOWO2_12_FULL_39_28]
MMARVKKVYALIPFFFFLLFIQSSHSASQNKLIAKKFKWRILKTAHFDLYHYQGADLLLPFVAEHLEHAYEEVTERLNIPVKGRLPFFFFLNHNDFEQNNIVDVGEGTGGVTEAFKNRFLIFNDGTQRWLEHVIKHEFTHEVQFYVLYSGFWKSAKLLKSVLYPLWFMEGMAEYASGEIDDPQKEMLLRDAVTSHTLLPLTMLHGFSHLKPNQITLAYKTGNAALDFIAQEYGAEKVGLLLENIAEKFDINNALQELLGLNIFELNEKFKESLEEKYEEESSQLKEPAHYAKKLTASDQIYPIFNTHPVFMPGGKEFIYLSDRSGVTELFIHDLLLNRSLPLNIQARFSKEIENIKRTGSALSISPDGATVLFAGETRQKDFLYFYDLKRDRLKKIKFPLESVTSPQFSPDGTKIIFIGMKQGISDIYIAYKNGKGLEQLTHTLEDENDLRFFPDGKSILFSRENISRTDIGFWNASQSSQHIKVQENRNDPKHLYERDLWSYSLETGKESKLLELAGNETQPFISSLGDSILFINDGANIYNLYALLLKEGKVLKLTEIIGGNFNPAISPERQEMLFVSYREGEHQIYRAELKTLFSQAREVKDFKLNSSQAFNKEKPEKSPISFHAKEDYVFKASTDFFFPILFYSSTDGLFLSAYWRASEMLGNHQMQTSFSYASRLDFLNYQILYSYLRFRPQIFFGFAGDTEENVLLTTREVRREDAQFVGVEYPLNRFEKLAARFLTTQRRVQFTDDSLGSLRSIGRENVFSLTYFKDVTQGRYLETSAGHRIIVTGEESNDQWRSQVDYRNIFVTLHQFAPLPKESALAFRAFGASSFGRDKQLFRVGGDDLLRGYGRFDLDSVGNRFLISNLEWRFPIFFDLNYHIWFLFPDFLFKNVYGSIFTDNGIVWSSRDQLLAYKIEDLRNSFGLGLRFQAFVLQTFPVVLQLDWARRTSDGEQVFYFTLGPHF